jgi:hypothetical protein
MDLLEGPDQDAAGGDQLLAPSRHFMAASIKRCRWLPCAPVDLSTEEAEAEGVPAVLALWSGDAQVGWGVLQRPPCAPARSWICVGGGRATPCSAAPPPQTRPP